MATIEVYATIIHDLYQLWVRYWLQVSVCFANIRNIFNCYKPLIRETKPSVR
jgi:hypothetical protein